VYLRNADLEERRSRYARMRPEIYTLKTSKNSNTYIDTLLECLYAKTHGAAITTEFDTHVISVIQ